MFFRRSKLDDVFTPTTAAKLCYISRTDLENTVSTNIVMPGKQVVIYGHSGSGKTTLTSHLLNKLGRNYIITHCESASTFNDILYYAFDSLNKYYTSQVKSVSSYSLSAGLKADFVQIRDQINSSICRNEERINTRIIPPQLTAQKLTQFLGEIKAIWIIEDFHKMAASEKKRLADVLKVFVDAANVYPKVKIICIGAVDTAHELLQLDDNLNTRIAELHVPLLSEEEIRELVLKGCKCLNIKMSEALVDKIVYYSNNLASLAHQLCYDICKANNIFRKKTFGTSIDDSCFKSAVEAYISSNSDTLKSIYDSVVKNQLAWYILKTFATKDKALSFNEIRARVCANARSFSDDVIREKLEELARPSCNVIRYNSNAEKFSIATPFWGAFLRMQLALENANIKKFRKNRKNQNLIIKNQADIDSEVYEVLLKQLEILRGYKPM